MSPDDFWKAILAFLLGLAAKFIYDLWKERRERKLLVFKKTITSSFVLNTLEEEIRDETKVYYQGHQVESIHFFQLDLENKSLKPTKNQSFTVRFGEDSAILGEPTSLSSSEDMRHVELDNKDATSFQNNSRRFLVRLLQGSRTLSWTFGVINHDENDFIVEHGVIGSGEELDKADLDVVSLITTESISPDLTVRITRLVTLFIFIVILSLASRTINNNIFVASIADFIQVILNIGIIGLWLFILREALSTIPLFMQWLEQRKGYRGVEGDYIHGDKVSGDKVAGDSIDVGDVSEARSVSVGNGASAQITSQPVGVDYETMQELLFLLEPKENSSSNLVGPEVTDS